MVAADHGVFVTNYLTFPVYTHPLSIPEVLNYAPEIGVPGFVLYCLYFPPKGHEPCHVVASGKRMPNGIEISPDGTRVFIMESLGQSVSAYDVPAHQHRTKGWRLQHRKTLRLGHVCDNLSIDQTGRIWTGCHPKALTYKFLHAKNQAFRSPSLVLSFDQELEAAREVPEISYTYIHTYICTVPCSLKQGRAASFVGGVQSPPPPS